MKDINAHFRHNRGKSLGAQFQEDVIFVIVGCFILYVIMGIFKVIFYPFRFLLMSTEQIEEEEKQKALEKARKREGYLEELHEDPSDPMFQYRLRFVEEKDKYKDDKYNETYRQWHEAWKEGLIRDTKLRWAPEVYEKVYLGKKISLAFLKYFEYQWNLHKEKWATRTAFLITVRRHYPEFTPTYHGLEADLSALKDRALEYKLKRDLIEEIQKLGLEERDAETLARMDLPGVELRKRAEIVKGCIEKGLMAGRFYIAEHSDDPRFRPDTPEAGLADKLLRAQLPEEVINAYFEGLINNEEVMKLKYKADDLVELWGWDYLLEPREDGPCLYRYLLTQDMNEMIEAHNQKKAVWE